MERSRSQVDALVQLLDHTLDEGESAFGDHRWHSLVGNLISVTPDAWDARPAGAGRTIRELVWHLGVTYLMHENHAFGDRSLRKADAGIDVGVGFGSAPEAHIRWLRGCHTVFRDSVAGLTDNRLDEVTECAWGDLLPFRRIIELMIQHPLYHGGEINHIRELVQGNDE